MDTCKHDYQLETVGGVYLTGAYVCRLCSYRIGMSDEEFHGQATYPNHYQAPHYEAEEIQGESVTERAVFTVERYRQRLKEQVRELRSENLAPELSEDDRNQILAEVIEDALSEIVKDCEEIAKGSGRQVVAELIDKKFSGRACFPYGKTS